MLLVWVIHSLSGRRSLVIGEGTMWSGVNDSKVVVVVLNV